MKKKLEHLRIELMNIKIIFLKFMKTDVAETMQGRLAYVDVRRVNSKPGSPLSIKIRSNTVVKNTNASRDGLSYDLSTDLSKLQYVVGGVFIVQATIVNTGGKGHEVVQLYVNDVESSVKRPIKQLVGFERISLEKGAKKQLLFEVKKEQLKFWDPVHDEWVLEKGKFEFMVGASSSDIRLQKVIKLKK